MKSLTEILNESLLNEGIAEDHIQRIDQSLSDNDWSKIKIPSLPCDCWIIEDDFPMDGNRTLKKILSNYGIEYKMKSKKSGYFNDKFAVLEVDDENKWKVYLILNKALCHGHGYDHLQGISTKEDANKAFNDSIGFVKIL